ncbi:MAG: hypothetical protein SGBAC_004373, partial [Bacillariaceae sp.]
GLLPSSPTYKSKSEVNTKPRNLLTFKSSSQDDDSLRDESNVGSKSMESIATEIVRNLVATEELSSISILELGCGTDTLWENLIEEAEKSSLKLQITRVLDSHKLATEAAERASQLVQRHGWSNHQITVMESSVLQHIQTLDESSNYDCVVLNYCVGDQRFKLRDILVKALNHGFEKMFVSKADGVDSTDLICLPQDSIDVAIVTQQLPLKLSKMVNDSYYFVAFEKCRGIGLQHIHRYKGAVSNGYGRGGKKLGVPTANLPSSLFQQALEDVGTGVYFGWAAIECHPGRTFKAVVNVGYSPTFEGRENKEKIIEAHLLLKDGEELDDFYGSILRLKLLGFLRPEEKFDSFPALIAQIEEDVSSADSLLDATPFRDLREDKFLETSKTWIGSGGGDKDASWEFSLMLTELESLSGSSSVLSGFQSEQC